MTDYIDGYNVNGTDYELHDTGSRSDVSDLKSALGVLEPEAVATDVGKYLRARTVSGGKVTEYELASGGADDYGDLINKPSINNVTLSGNKSLSEIGAAQKSDFDALAAFVNYNDIATFTASPSAAEIGNASASIALAWTFNATPSSLTLNGVTKSPSSTGETVTATDDGSTHQVKYTLETAIGSKEVTFHFYPKVYYGADELPGTINSAFLLGLSNGVLTGTRARTFTVNAGTGKYIWYAVPARYGACSFNVGGFDGGFTKISTISYTNASGYTESYDVYRSDNASLGNTTVTVS